MNDFFDDVPSTASRVAMTADGLPPIVEVPSDAISTTTDGTKDTGRDTDRDTCRDSASAMSTFRTDQSDYSEPIDTQRTDEQDSENGSTQEDETPRIGRHMNNKKRRVKNGRNHIDMTPPDKLLKKAEKKAKRFYAEKKADKSIREFTRITALARIVHGTGHWKLARSHTNLAEAYLELKGYAPQAQYHCEEAKATLNSSVQTSNSSTDKANILEVHMKTHYILGKSLTQLKKLNEAEAALTRTDKISRERSKISSVTDDDLDDWDIKIYLAVARLSAKQQKQAVATTNFEKALGLMEVKYGEDGLQLIPVYQGLGYVEQSKGQHANHDQAIEHFLQAHSIASSYYKDTSVEVAETARALAGAYSNVATDDAETSAESYLNECLAVYQVVYGPNHQKTLDVQDDLARLMVRTDRAEEATSLLRTTIEAKKDVFGDLSAEVASTWKLLGSIQLSQGDSEKALRALKKCHNVQCSIYGANHKSSKETQRTMDILLANPSLKAKQKKSAEEILKERPRFNSIVSRDTALGGFK